MTTVKRWSYSTGERGRNRVRGYEDRTGLILVEYHEREPERFQLVRKRVSLGHRDRRRAKQRADELAAAFGRGQAPADGSVTLETLFDIYVREVTPRKSAGKQRHDRACAEMFLRFFGRRRQTRELNRRDWDRFIAARRSGVVAPASKRSGTPVMNRQIEYDLRWLLAVLNWATTSRDDRQRALLERNPFTGLKPPKEQSPRRPRFTPRQYKALRKVAAQVDPLFELAVIVTHETGHRIGSVRRLRWSDLDLKRKWVRWVSAHDKTKTEHEGPLSSRAVRALQRARRSSPAIGDAWVFPSPGDPTQPCSRHIMRDWMEQALREVRLGGCRFGWHSFRRKFATELKHIPLKDLCDLGGWKDARTVIQCYQEADEGTMRRALAGRRAVGALDNRHVNRQ